MQLLMATTICVSQMVVKTFLIQDSPGSVFIAKLQFSGGVLKLWCTNDHTLVQLR